MTWFKNLRTMTKLMLGFGFLALLTGVVGYEGLSGIAATNQQVESLYKRDLSGIAAIKDVNIDVLKIARQLRGVLLGASIEDGTQKIDVHFREADEAIGKCDQFFLSDQGKAAVARIKPMLIQYHSGISDLLQIAAKDRSAAVAAMPKVASVADQLDAAVLEAVELKDQLGLKRYQESQSNYEQKRSLMLVLMLGSLGLGIALGMAIGKMVATPLGRTVEVLESVAGGDLTRSLDVATADEVGQMAKALNTAVGSIQHALVEVRGSADSVASASQQLAASSEELSSGAQEQASGLEETSASLEEITSSVKQNADNARQANQLAVAARETAEKGGQVVSSAVSAMGEINTASKRIADIITTIDEIAFQTNLLALNAAVEAARAGEQGRGFAVVAAEVRSLAQRSATAAKEIKTLIQDSVRKVEAGSQMVNQSGDVLLEIVSSIKRVADIVGEIAAASREQSAGVEQVAKAMSQMDQVTQQNASQTEELSSTAQVLAAHADQLQTLAGKFQLDREGKIGPRATKTAAAPHANPGKRLPASKTFTKSLQSLSQQAARTGRQAADPLPLSPEPAAVEQGSGFTDF